MISVDWGACETGRQSASKLLRRVSAIVRRDRVAGFKVGITNSPDIRASAPDYRDYERMIVLYKTKSLKNVRDMEARLVMHFSEHELCHNIRAGGGGSYGDPPYYLYVVVR